MPPKLFIVAGPPGGGKSTAFPVSGFGVDFFNADDRAAALNQGSYLDIPRGIRGQVNLLFESFVLSHIERKASCAFETTLRSRVTFEQAAIAKRAGFTTEMRYVALQHFAMHLERVRMRADAGGHSAPESLLKAIYQSSINNLPQAIHEMDSLYVYDNSSWGITPTILLQADHGHVAYLAADLPDWLKTVLGQL
jgi:predicted ABC-type ATPase